MEYIQEQLTRFYQELSQLSWKMKKLEKDFSCSQCTSVKRCLDISNSGDVNKFLNERGDFIIISPSLDCEDIKECIGITPTGAANKFLNEQGDYVTVSGSGFTCSDLLTCSTTNLPEGTNLYFTNLRAISALTGQNISIFTNNSGYITNAALALYLTSATAAATYQPIGSYLTTIAGLNISLLTNDSGYITNTALAPYLTSANAALTYYSLTNPSSYISLTALSAGTGISYNNGTGVITNTDLGSSQNIFKNIAVSGQNTVVADSNNDTLTLVAGTGITITTDDTTDSITITNSSSGGFITSITDTNTVDLDVSLSVLTANIRHQDTTTINLSDDASGLKADLATGAAAANLGFTPENVANKATDFTTINDTLYPSVEAVEERIGNPITHLNIFTHLTEFVGSTSTGSFLIAGSTVQSLNGWSIRKDGTNASAAIQASEAGKNGILRLGTGTTTTGAFRLTAQNIWLDGQSFVYECPIRVQALSTNAQDYYISLGMVVGNVLVPTGALRVFYNHATNSGNFVCERTAGGLTSTINTAVALTANTWFTIRIVKYSNGTVEFFIDGVSMGAASAVNVPTGTSLALGFFLFKTAGSTERTCDLDYAYYRET